jgi:hypothetical protein
MPLVFGDFDISAFWENSNYAQENYTGKPLTDAMVREAEQELGFRLPASYIELMKHRNGGIPVKKCHRTRERSSWAEDHIAINGIYGLDRDREYSLCGYFCSRFWETEWEYPHIGIYICDCPSAGHDMVCLDYRYCGPDGEPQVVHIDNESDNKITFVARNFESFIRGLDDDEAFE